MVEDDGPLAFLEVRAPRSGEPEGLFVTHPGPPVTSGALVLRRPTGTWLYSPTAVHQSLMTDLAYPRRPAGPTPA